MGEGEAMINLPEKPTGGYEVIPSDHAESLAKIFSIYMETVGGARTSNTRKAKLRDLQQFLHYLAGPWIELDGDNEIPLETGVLGHDHPDAWTKNITEDFVRSLVIDRKLAASTANRALFTLKHAAGWIETHRPFLVGNPTEGVTKYRTDEPEWLGLHRHEVVKLMTAANQLVVIRTRGDQFPERDRALFHILLGTALRVSEVCNLNLEQYRDGYLWRVQCKGKKEFEKKKVPADAQRVLEEYLDRRGRGAGPLFQNRYAKRITPDGVNDALARIAAHANSTLRDDEQIYVTAHKCRHTKGKAVEKKRGLTRAADFLGHADVRYTRRYTKSTQTELDQAADDRPF